MSDPVETARNCSRLVDALIAERDRLRVELAAIKTAALNTLAAADGVIEGEWGGGGAPHVSLEDYDRVASKLRKLVTAPDSVA